ncbi:hypothetical protein BKA66DRAFT_285049 [Pyrenochaeta sp. MPI-SDFR-AT-0127]|nr:hypothetical protein BKA66DRAFT_285049 [Pyrenochaeta sp. MPI-SDFR-AT-0127]
MSQAGHALRAPRSNCISNPAVMLHVNLRVGVPHTSDTTSINTTLLLIIIISTFIVLARPVRHLATILAEENSKLRASNTRLRRRKDRQRQYIAAGGALQVQAGRALAVAAERALNVRVEGEASRPRQRAPPTCSKCGVQGHIRTSCRQR